jgi:hypothetical protein
MSTLSSVLRAIVVVLGIFLVIAAIKSEQWLSALVLTCFFGIAFSSLSFSGIDREAISPASSRWFLIAAAFGAVGFLVIAVFLVGALLDGNTKSAMRYGGGLIVASSVVWNKRKEVASAVRRGYQAFSSAGSENTKRAG